MDVVVMTVINNVMFCATNRSPEQSLFGREERNVLVAVCALTLQNNPDEKIFFFLVQFQPTLTMGKALYQRLQGDHFLTLQRRMEAGHKLQPQEFSKQD